MKRYWKIISICIVTLIVIGTFYIQSSFATNDHVEIEFEKIYGNKDEVEDLILSGHYQVGHFYQSLQITSKETGDPDNLSFFERVERLDIPASFKGLVDRHKNFMRGKDLTSTHFFEDENVLAYASIKADNVYEIPMKDLAFTIEVMDKKSKEVTSMELDVPERNKYSYLYVEHVQVINDELKIITQGYGMDYTDELHVYTIDLKEQELVNDDTIVSGPSVEDGWSHLRVVNQIESFQGQDYFLIQIEAFEEDMAQIDGEHNEIANEYIVYDIENNQSKQIVIPDEVLGSIGGESAILDDKIYVPSQSENGLEVNVYDIANEEWGEKLTVELRDIKDDEPSYIKMINGKLIAVYATNDGQNLLIGDLKTGESLYEGKLQVKNQGEGPQDYRLYIYEAEFAQ